MLNSIATSFRMLSAFMHREVQAAIRVERPRLFQPASAGHSQVLQQIHEYKSCLRLSNSIPLTSLTNSQRVSVSYPLDLLLLRNARATALPAKSCQRSWACPPSQAYHSFNGIVAVPLSLCKILSKILRKHKQYAKLKIASGSSRRPGCP